MFKILYRLLEENHDLRGRLAHFEADVAEADSILREVRVTLKTLKHCPSLMCFILLCGKAVGPRAKLLLGTAVIGDVQYTTN